MKPGRSLVIETILTSTVAVVAFAVVWGLRAEDISLLVPSLLVAGFTTIGFALLRWVVNPDHLQARQSDQILKIANITQQYLRGGLSEESAQNVCRAILPATEATAIAITDTHTILGFAGTGEDHHSVGGPIITRATMKTLEDKNVHVLASREEIGCTDSNCPLKGAVVVPLQLQDRAIGTLKFYYKSSRHVKETQIAMAEGLANLLSTQLGLAELERQTDLATRAELKALQSQINPHFLFNTINTIAALIRTDPAQARILLREFAIFYRRTLENADDFISLHKEIEQTHRYLGFEIARFGDRIRVDTDIDPELSELLVPAFIIQPLVENSVNHGMRPEGTLNITLVVRRVDGDVIIEVRDDGVGILPDELPRVLKTGYGTGLGIALKNVQDRLKGYFGPEASMGIQSEADKGTTVTLYLSGARPVNWR